MYLKYSTKPDETKTAKKEMRVASLAAQNQKESGDKT